MGIRVTSRYLQDDVLRPLREETTKGDSTGVALLYGPVVLAGCLAEVAHPFSDPKKYNDYYTIAHAFDIAGRSESRPSAVSPHSTLAMARTSSHQTILVSDFIGGRGVSAPIWVILHTVLIYAST